MKKIMLPLLVLAMFSFSTADTELTSTERKKAVEEMTQTKDHLLNVLKGLSAAQLNFKSSPESWSIAECTEHIAISENNIFAMIDGLLKTTADPSKRDSVKMTDDQVLAMIVDRSHKVKTIKSFEPTGKYGSHEATLKDFLEKRKEHINFVKRTKEDLRNRYQQLPFGTIDGYQVLLFMSAHTGRHIKQIEEVMADENFPKN
ncbi:MAG: DinB family protein [Ferruginibacter sp.]